MCDLINPDWHRPNDWPYKEDWGSPAWKRRMIEVHKNISQRQRNNGFICCPVCNTLHTTHTLMCRECQYQTKSEGII